MINFPLKRSPSLLRMNITPSNVNVSAEKLVEAGEERGVGRGEWERERRGERGEGRVERGEWRREGGDKTRYLNIRILRLCFVDIKEERKILRER